MAKWGVRTGILALILAFGISYTASADPTSDEIQKQNAQLQNFKEQLSSTQDKRQELESQMEQMDEQIINMMAQIDENNKQIKDSENSLKEEQLNLDKANKDLKDYQELYNQRIRNMYINGLSGYLEVIFSAKSFSNLQDRYEALKRVMMFDKNILADLDNKKSAVEKKQNDLIDEDNKLRLLKAENENKLSKLNYDKKQQELMLAQIKQQETIFASIIDTTQNQINNLVKQIQNGQTPASEIAVSRGNMTFKAGDLLAFATKYLGTPYLWGGEDPSKGFDCSGFTQYVFAHFGIQIHRTTYDQINDGASISKEDLEPGDLVFFGTTEDPHHVGIYLGNNYFIHAPRTGDVIKISPLTRNDFIKGVRIL